MKVMRTALPRKAVRSTGLPSESSSFSGGALVAGETLAPEKETLVVVAPVESEPPHPVSARQRRRSAARPTAIGWRCDVGLWLLIGTPWTSPWREPIDYRHGTADRSR